MKQNVRSATLLLLLGAAMLLLAHMVMAAPTGASLTSNTTDYGPTISPTGLTHNRSTITTVVLDALQQDQRWKGYVGNVSGSLTLDNANNDTLYDWSSVTAAVGEVYASRSSGITFASPVCADAGTIGVEETALNMTGAEVDSITNTFDNTNHTDTNVGATLLSGCPMVATYENDADPGQDSAANFQEFLMEDATNNLVYVSILNDNTPTGYDGNTYDFQMIVAESDIQATANTYYFWVELGS